MTDKTQPKTEAATPLKSIVNRMNADECDWDDIIDYIQIEMLGFCGCGAPEANLEFIMNGLALINDDGPSDFNNRHAWHNEWKKQGINIFGNELSMRFFFYWCDKEELTEHGSGLSSGGWLTEKGRELFDALKELKKNGVFDE